MNLDSSCLCCWLLFADLARQFNPPSRCAPWQLSQFRPANFHLCLPVQVLGLMEAAAKVLPPDDVHYEIVRRLAGLEPFVDFAASDPAARGALLGGCFRVLETLGARGLDVCALAAGVAAHFGAAAAELEELVRRLARARREHDIDADQPLALGPYRQVKPLTCKAL